MPYVSDWTQPAKLGKSLGMPFWGNLKPVIGASGGDFTCAAAILGGGAGPGLRERCPYLRIRRGRATDTGSVQYCFSHL